MIYTYAAYLYDHHSCRIQDSGPILDICEIALLLFKNLQLIENKPKRDIPV